MFNKIQNHLLLRHPLLWNIKIVPMLAITLAINIFFYLIGFAKGALDFTQYQYAYTLSDNTPTIIFFAVLISLITLILWLVYYFRNNAFKSFYPKSGLSLYKEWLLILLISLLNCSYTASFMAGNDARKTAYFSDKELQHRLDVLTMVSLFTNDATIYNNYEAVAPAAVEPAVTDTIATDTVVVVEEKSQKISLLDKNVDGFGGFGRYTRYSNTYSNRDSINNQRIKSWLAKGSRDSVVWLLTKFTNIAKSHNLKGNISPEEWTKLVYKAPEFTDFEYIRTRNTADYTETSVYNGDYENERYNNKYYAPYDELRYNYEQMYEAEYRPFINSDSILGYLIGGFSMSLFIFSFRVTSGRGWLIALVSVGITAMLVGLLAFIFQSGTAYPLIWLMIIIGLLIYYFAIVAQKQGKGMTDIILNCIIWLLSTVLPIIVGIIIINRFSNYEYYYEGKDAYTLSRRLEDNMDIVMYVNLLLVAVYMLFISYSIKKWKGISES